MHTFQGLLGYGVDCDAFERGRLAGQSGAEKENQSRESHDYLLSLSHAQYSVK
jgi:hypothetical protein